MIPALALLLSSASGQIYSVSPLPGAVVAAECAKSETMSLDPCVAYIMGAADILSVDHTFCLSGSSWAAQVVAVTRKYLRENPEQWDTHPAWLVRRALTKAFPCAASRP